MRQLDVPLDVPCLMENDVDCRRDIKRSKPVHPKWREDRSFPCRIEKHRHRYAGDLYDGIRSSSKLPFRTFWRALCLLVTTVISCFAYTTSILRESRSNNMLLKVISIVLTLRFCTSTLAFPTEGPAQLLKRDSSKPVVDLGYAVYQGTTLEAGVNQYLGIQYGAPPLGDLRWRAPQDPTTNRTLHQATEFAPTCLGLFGQIEATKDVNEDCLYLDVFAPSDATADSKLPVWFFIQGGGYAGNTDQNFNFTEVIVQSNHSMVAVQINYRVGVFGFLASEEIQQNGELNVGLLDQRKCVSTF